MESRPIPKKWRASLSLLLLLLGSWLSAQAQIVPVMPTVGLDSVRVAPQAVDVSGWLLLNEDIQLELGGAVQNLYNFKFDKANKQFRSLRRRYPEHPMAYFLLGLSTWWKIMPTGPGDTRYDKVFLAYLDTAQTKAEALYRADAHNYEACFFLSGAYGMEARLHAERHDWRKATLASRRSLTYFQKSQEFNGLSSEFLFGQGLFDYYASWISEEYPWLRPVLFFFPKGNRARGLAQLQQVSQTAFYTGVEARAYLVDILGGTREKQTPAACELARQLTTQFPDNSYFQLRYARLTFELGRVEESEAACRSLLSKYAKGQVGYEAYACRPAAYILGYLMQHKYRDLAQAKDYYQRCVAYSEQAGVTKRGYYVFAQSGLAHLALYEQDETAAHRYYRLIVEQADSGEQEYKEARAWLRAHR